MPVSSLGNRSLLMVNDSILMVGERLFINKNVRNLKCSSNYNALFAYI